MRRVMTIVRREYLQRVRNKWFLAATLLIPALMLGATFAPIVLAERSQSRPLSVAILDGTGGELGDRMVELLAEQEMEGRAWRPGGAAGTLRSIDDLRTEIGSDPVVAAETADVFLLLPADVADGATPSVITVKDIGFRERSLRRTVEDAVHWWRAREAGLDGAGAEALLADVDLNVQPLATEERRDDGFQIVGFAFAMMLYFMFLVYGQMVARGVLEEKTSDIVEILVSSVRPWEMMLGKILGIGAVGLTQVGIWAVVGFVLSMFGLGGQVGEFFGNAADIAEFAFPTSILVFAFLYFVLGYLMYSAIFAGAGAMLTSEQDIQQVLIPVMMPIVFPILIISQVIDTPNRPWIMATSLFPLFSPILMPVRNAIANVPFWQNLAAVVLLVVAIFVAAWIAGRIYRVGILMKGKRPTMGELMRWMRHG